MTRLLATVLVLCAQFLAVLAPGAMVVCVHADGSSAIEFIGLRCCDVRRVEAHAAPASADGASLCPQEECADGCRDTPFTQDQVTVTRLTAEREPETVSEDRTESPAATAWHAPEWSLAAQVASRDVTPRPPDTRAQRPCFVSRRI